MGKRMSLGGAEGVEEGQAAEKGRRKTVLGAKAETKKPRKSLSSRSHFNCLFASVNLNSLFCGEAILGS